MAALHADFQGAVPYKRHRPEKNLLYRTVQTYWPEFVEQQKRVGRVLPLFIHNEFEKFLECGIPEHGFVRIYCHQCQHSGIVPFSCKGRGFCPSCLGRRMNDEAAHLVDHVFPEVAMRQWVLSFPYKLRFLMAFNQKLTSQALSIFIKEISRYQKAKAREIGFAMAKAGAVTFIQRFGSALNLNVHFHTLIPDGVFHKQGDTYAFRKLSNPTQEELFQITERIHHRVLKIIKKLGLEEDYQGEFDESILCQVSALSIAHKAGFGERAGQGLRRFGVKNFEIDPESNDPYSVNINGFSLNARVVIGSKKRDRLERLVRYVARGPIAVNRLSQSFPGQLLYHLKTPWRDGTTHVSFSPLDFIARLVALIPPTKNEFGEISRCICSSFR